MTTVRTIGVALVLLMAGSVSAQGAPAKTATAPAPAPAAAPSDSELVHTLYQKGKAEYDLGNYAAAVGYFEELYRLRPVPALLFNIGQCHRFIGNLEKAASTFRSYLRNAAPNDPHAAQARELLGEVEKAIAQKQRLERTPPTGLAGGSVGAPSGMASSTTPASPSSAAIGAGNADDSLSPSPVNTTPTSNSHATVAIATNPPSPSAAPPDSSPPSSPAIIRAPADAAEVRAVPAPAPKRTRIFTWVAAGGAAVALGVGAYFGAQSKSLESNLQSGPHPRAQVDADTATAKSDATKGTALLIAGGVLAAGAGALFFLRF